MIDNQIIAFYLNKDPAKESFVKFGGYDMESFKDKDSMKLLNTDADNTWTIAVE